MKALRHRIAELLEPNSGQKAGMAVDITIMSLILLNIVAVVLESVESISLKYERVFESFELISVIVFTVEYLLRIWTAVEVPKYSNPLFGRLRYAGSMYAIIDLIAILPFYLPFVGFDLRFARMLRLLRILRFFKLTRYFRALQLIGEVIRIKRGELVVTISLLLFLLLFVSCIMYIVENSAQPEAFRSIPQTMWWGVATLTTVGYGDIYPITGLGKIMGSLIAILGIGFFALPAGILSSGFAIALKDKRHTSNEVNSKVN